MKTGKLIIPFVLLVIWIPFIAQTDFYPLFRFGMFAEPVQREVQTESFLVRVSENTGKQRIVDPEETGLGSLAYLMRNYYYRQESEILLQRIHALAPHAESIAEWQLVRIISPISTYKPDTTVVAVFKVRQHE